jgi:hypothetical protein
MHTCPNCGQACYCGGDVDDCPSVFDPGGCHHDCQEESDEFDEWDEEEILP